MAASSGNVVFRVNSSVNKSVQIKLELGHKATVREECTQEGHTHDWVVFVQGLGIKRNIHHFIERVVFQLNDNYSKPRRVVVSPPYEVHETDSAGFLMPIEIHFKNEHEPKKLTFQYDLSFCNVVGMPPDCHTQCETLTFHSPTGDFKRKLLQGGGMELHDPHAESAGDDSDIWDDTALIKAYDKAINSFKGIEQGADEELSEGKGKPKSSKHSKKYKKKKKRKNKWRVGDQCQAVFSEDGQLYNAVIKSINYKMATCWVTYVGYGNEEEQNISDLMASVHIENNTSAQENDYDSSMDYMDCSPYQPGQSNTSRPSSRGSQHQQHQQQMRAAHPGWFPPAPSFPPAPFVSPFPPPPPAWGMAPYQTPQFPHGGMPAGFPFVHMAHSPNTSMGLPAVPPPPASDVDDADDTGIHSMLMAWYMSGYHTGYYQGLRQGKRLSSSNTPEPKHGRHHRPPVSQSNNPGEASDSNNTEDDTR